MTSFEIRRGDIEMSGGIWELTSRFIYMFCIRPTLYNRFLQPVGGFVNIMVVVISV